MKTNEDIMTLIAGFYAEQCGNSPQPNPSCTGEFMSLLRSLHGRVFPGYRFDEAQLLAQAQAQLRGNSRAVQGYHMIILKFAPLGANTQAAFHPPWRHVEMGTTRPLRGGPRYQ